MVGNEISVQRVMQQTAGCKGRGGVGSPCASLPVAERRLDLTQKVCPLGRPPARQRARHFGKRGQPGRTSVSGLSCTCSSGRSYLMAPVAVRACNGTTPPTPISKTVGAANLTTTMTDRSRDTDAVFDALRFSTSGGSSITYQSLIINHRLYSTTVSHRSLLVTGPRLQRRTRVSNCQTQPRAPGEASRPSKRNGALVAGQAISPAQASARLPLADAGLLGP